MGIAADGEYDAKALKVNPQLGDPFSGSLDWLGVGALSGSQPFVVYQDVAPPEYPEWIFEGRTTPAGGVIEVIRVPGHQTPRWDMPQRGK